MGNSKLVPKNIVNAKNDEFMEAEVKEFNDTQTNVMIQDKPVNAVKDDSEYTIEIIKDDIDVDVTRIPNPDPKYAYRFLSTKESNLFKKTSNLLHSHGGWQLCGEEHLKRIGIPDNLINADKHYRLGNDLVLAFMPKELFNEKLEVKQRKSLEPLNAVQRLVKDGGEGLLPKEKLPSNKW